MGRLTNLRDIIGMIKDKASQGKATLTSNPKTPSLHLALLKATTHDPSTLPHPKHIATLLSFGHSSRATAAAAIEAIMDRLQSTQDCSVAVKCLINIHHIIRDGSFILQDQLSVYPSTGGRNYLKLSNFRDNATPITWELSSWVRWYARYLEHLLSASRVLGFFLCSNSSTSEKDKEEGKVSELTNSDLLKDIDSLVGLLEEICQRPGCLHLQNNTLVGEITNMVGEDHLSAINDLLIRVNEFHERLSCLSFGNSVELACILKRLDTCKEGIVDLPIRKRDFAESLWCVVSEMKGKVESGKGYGEEGRLLLTLGRGEKASESARFGERVLSYSHSRAFSSSRFSLNRYGFTELDCFESYAR
ncbi:hypothetical protein K2173_014674 [Erythroxylum novogranatense]|uniref:ENTH domain-containing protein n=1 Tax=Erythroxylum novogranatense TaxID=1862640 RepID=A0AAV8TFA8_9ROSI|nr:hypothetical protein K2173_014674 [Erythroxylum novogranatense]